jgi:predicted DNA-binding transcriptional regulator AlpA
MGETTDRFFLYPRQLLSGGKVDVLDAVNLVIYAKVPLVEMRSGRDLVNGFVGRENPYGNAFLTQKHEDEIFDRFRKSIDVLKFPVTPSQYQPLLEEMLERGEYALPYFYQEHQQVVDRRQRIALFAEVHAELQKEFESNALPLHRTESELSNVCALGSWMAPRTFRAYLERRGVAPWWESESNIASHARLERILPTDSSRGRGFTYVPGYDLQNVPSFVFASMLLQRSQSRQGYANISHLGAVDFRSAEHRSPEEELPKKQVVATRPQALRERSENETRDYETQPAADHLPSQSQEVKRSIRDGQPLENAKSGISQVSHPDILPATLPKTGEGLLTKKQVSKLLGVSENTVDNYRRRPGFPKEIKLGSHTVRWERSAIEGWITLQK